MRTLVFLAEVDDGLSLYLRREITTRIRSREERYLVTCLKTRSVAKLDEPGLPSKSWTS